MKRRPCWCPKPILWELNSFFYANAFSCFIKFAKMLATWVKTFYTGWLFVPTRKAIRYSMNNNGIKLEQVVHTHRAGAVGREGSQSSLLNINFRLGRFQSSVLLIKKFKIPRWRRPRKRRLKSEFAFFQSHCDFSNSLTSSNASEFFLRRTPKNHIQVQKEKENLAVACLRPPSNVKLGIFLS